MLTNKQFADQVDEFREACVKVGLPNHKIVIHTRTSKTERTGVPSLTRQASKWRNRKGLAYKTFKGIS